MFVRERGIRRGGLTGRPAFSRRWPNRAVVPARDDGSGHETRRREHQEKPHGLARHLDNLDEHEEAKVDGGVLTRDGRSLVYGEEEMGHTGRGTERRGRRGSSPRSHWRGRRGTGRPGGGAILVGFHGGRRRVE